ncbi:MSHA biogenesis protein MshJ [Pseudomethylobacillus aquaticus]|uniref:MSHA biogenesis protein MshJ n=1 Tax=Pseudomethylobacillus aquaticus TaxID=2676064 RepID=A0A3N0V376_9PROT|nr:MSHA biogenesis protein MshJ [Pseudomethylobacillus aquaticus]ROH87219.1 MSHA biogenesis protein MshJ [Pseudomethylobacillus aquaticus]
MRMIWQRLSGKFLAFSRRERLLLLFAALAALWFMHDTLLLTPLSARQQAESAELVSSRVQIEQMTQQIQSFQTQAVVDPDAENKALLAELQQRTQALEDKLKGLQGALVSPEQMPELLRGLLRKNAKLQLVEFNTLPASRFAPALAAEPANSANGVSEGMYQHMVEITVDGRYADLMAYVAAVESLPQRVLWRQLKLNVEQYPRSRLKLVVYTLSLDAAWLNL